MSSYGESTYFSISKPDAKGNITVTFSAEAPKNDTNWMPVNAGEQYYFISRHYRTYLTNQPEVAKNLRMAYPLYNEDVHFVPLNHPEMLKQNAIGTY